MDGRAGVGFSGVLEAKRIKGSCPQWRRFVLTAWNLIKTRPALWFHQAVNFLRG